jgi:uncharacterized protein
MSAGATAIKLGIKAAIALGVLVLLLRLFERMQVFMPSRRLVCGPAALGRPFEEVMIRTDDGIQINAWYYPAQSGAARTNLVILHCHGNAGNLSHRIEHFSLMSDTGVNVLGFDYRGYGRSTGSPSEQGLIADAVAAYRWLRAKGFASDDILVLGESLGGAVAAALAARVPVGGLILQSSFTSVTDLGSELFPWLPVRWLGHIHFDTFSKLPQIHAPVMVMHSRADQLVRFHHAEANFARITAPKILWEIAGDHNDALVLRPDLCRQGLEQFYQLVDQTRSQRSGAH